MVKRIITGTLLMVGTLALIIWGVLPFTLEVTVIGVLGIVEFYNLSIRKGIRPSKAMGVMGLLFFMLNGYMGGEEYMSSVLLGCSMITMLLFIFRKEFHVSSFLDVGVTVMGFMYMGWFFSYILLIRRMDGYFDFFGIPVEHGIIFVLMLIFATSFTDIVAFFVGKFMGKHKLCPHISPNKTVEGSIGGLLGAVLGSYIIGSLVKIPIEDIINIGIICGVFAELGDIWESILKRDVKVKDSGDIVVGHGGIMDRFDSILFTSPIVYFYLKNFF